MPDKLAYGFPDDQKYKSDDSWHRVWVNDVGDRILLREAQGYRRYREKQGDEWGKEVRRIVGTDRTAVLMEIPQARYQAHVSPVPADGGPVWSMAHGGWVGGYHPNHYEDDPDADPPRDINDELDRAIHKMIKPQGRGIRHWLNGIEPADYDPSGKPVFGFLPTREWCNPWNPYRILGFPKMGEPFRALLNFTRGDRSLRLVLRYHNDRYWYVRLRWWPWKFTCELRRPETEDDRLDRKYGGKPEPEYEIKSKW